MSWFIGHRMCLTANIRRPMPVLSATTSALLSEVSLAWAVRQHMLERLGKKKRALWGSLLVFA